MLSKSSVSRIARRVLPDVYVRSRHVEAGIKLTVSLRRHLMFWSGGLSNYEPKAVRVLRAAVEPGNTVLDVGANIGFYSTLFSRWVGGPGRVLAFEPDPMNALELRQNLAVNHCHNVNVFELAIADRSGSESFSVDRATGATGKLGSTMTTGETTVGENRYELRETAVETIDEILRTSGSGADLIKLDIEGGEFRALAGATRTLQSYHPIILSEISRDGGTQVLKALRDFGYDLWDVEAGTPVERGSWPFMVVGIPEDSLSSPKALTIRTILSEAAGSRQ